MVLVLRDTQGQQNQRETHLYMEYLFWIEMQRQLNEKKKKRSFFNYSTGTIRFIYF